MADVFECANYLIANCPGVDRNVFDSNMKLQKVLFFANLISLEKRNELLFDEPVFAFEQGCVVESVRLRFKNNFNQLVDDAGRLIPHFDDDELEALNTAIAIYGGASAKELSEANHAFDFWRRSYEHSITPALQADKRLSVVSEEDMRAELNKIRTVLSAYEQLNQLNHRVETVNGIDFFYDPDEIQIDDAVTAHLYDFSLFADDISYTVCYDEEKLVIY